MGVIRIRLKSLDFFGATELAHASPYSLVHFVVNRIIIKGTKRTSNTVFLNWSRALPCMRNMWRENPPRYSEYWQLKREQTEFLGPRLDCKEEVSGRNPKQIIGKFVFFDSVHLINGKADAQRGQTASIPRWEQNQD